MAGLTGKKTVGGKVSAVVALDPGLRIKQLKTFEAELLPFQLALFSHWCHQNAVSVQKTRKLQRFFYRFS